MPFHVIPHVSFSFYVIFSLAENLLILFFYYYYYLFILFITKQQQTLCNVRTGEGFCLIIFRLLIMMFDLAVR